MIRRHRLTIEREDGTITELENVPGEAKEGGAEVCEFALPTVHLPDEIGPGERLTLRVSWWNKRLGEP